MRTRDAAAPKFDATTTSLRGDILSGAMPPGTLLAESSVARRLGVSRMPVREALYRLEREGLVEFSATGRAFVKELSPADFEELFLLRLALEPVGARLAQAELQRNPSVLIENIAATKRAQTVAEVTRLDLDFHELILAASGQQRLVKLWRSLRSELELWLGRLHERHQFHTQSTRRETVRSHSGILRCIRERTPAALEKLLRQHILSWRDWLPAEESQP